MDNQMEGKMADITKCCCSSAMLNNVKYCLCPVARYCYRYTVKPSGWQSYCDFLHEFHPASDYCPEFILNETGRTLANSEKEFWEVFKGRLRNKQEGVETPEPLLKKWFLLFGIED